MRTQSLSPCARTCGMRTRMLKGRDRGEARGAVAAKVEAVLAKWRGEEKIED